MIAAKELPEGAEATVVGEGDAGESRVL